MTVGLAVYVADIIDGSHPTAEVRNIVISLMTKIYFVKLFYEGRTLISLCIIQETKSFLKKIIEIREYIGNKQPIEKTQKNF